MEMPVFAAKKTYSKKREVKMNTGKTVFPQLINYLPFMNFITVLIVMTVIIK